MVLFMNAKNSMRRRRLVWVAKTFPVATSSAANSVVGAPVGQFQIALRPLQRLDRWLLIDAQHNGPLGRSDVEPDNLRRFGSKFRIVALAPGLARRKIDLVVPQEPPNILDIDVAEGVGKQWPRPPREPGS